MAKKEKKEKKGFFKEFKEFISRGNVLDMAIGIIIGGAFTAIVTALCNNVLKPIINWILAALIGTNGLDGIYTFLRDPAYTADGTIDLANSIYIDWGTLINAIINFLLIALVLFLIIKIINHVRRAGEIAKEKAQEAAARRQAEREAEEEKAAKEAAQVAAQAPAAPTDSASAPTEPPQKG